MAPHDDRAVADATTMSVDRRMAYDLCHRPDTVVWARSSVSYASPGARDPLASSKRALPASCLLAAGC